MAVETQIDIEHLDTLVKEYLPFLIRTTSTATGRYVSVEHDDAFSIALSAFAEAVERFQPERGAFLSFAGLVIRSRLSTYLAQERKHGGSLSLDAMLEAGQDVAAPPEGPSPLAEEIDLYEQELAKFGLTLELLADCSPRHRDTRKTAAGIAEQSSGDEHIVSHTYEKRRLPIRAVARLCRVSEKIVKTSKTFILATMLIFVRNLPELMRWVRGTGV